MFALPKSRRAGKQPAATGEEQAAGRTPRPEMVVGAGIEPASASFQDAEFTCYSTRP